MAKLTIKFVIDLDRDSVANIRPQDVEALRAYGIMGLDWVQDMQADLDRIYDQMHREIFPRIYEDEQ